MSFEANSDVPPRSLAEQRRMSVLPQFSTIVSATARPLGARHLTDRLEPENAASAGLTQPRQGVLEAPPRPPECRAAPCFTHPRMEKGVPSWRVVYSSTRMAELAVERTEPNMRSLPSSRNGPAAGPASRARRD